jgi:hypothetical protein
MRGCRYELCSLLGLFVVEEANIETHGFDPTFTDNNLNPACRWDRACCKAACASVLEALGRLVLDTRTHSIEPCIERMH